MSDADCWAQKSVGDSENSKTQAAEAARRVGDSSGRADAHQVLECSSEAAQEDE